MTGVSENAPGQPVSATMTVTQVAQALQISRGLAYELAARGQLPVLRLGRRILIPTAAFREWLADVRPTPPVEEP